MAVNKKEFQEVKEEIYMPVRIGNSYVTEAAAQFAQKAKSEDAEKGKNLSIYLNKDGYASKERAFSFVSSSGVDDTYKGYSYTMKLTDIEI